MKTAAYRSVDTMILARAAAISLVVIHHAIAGPLVQGGLNALLILSGMAMAKFGLGRGTKDAVRAFGHFGLRLVVPSLILAVITFAAVGRFDIYELALVSNWMHVSRISQFPMWYTQAVAQLLAALALLFVLTDMGSRIRKDRVLWTAILYAAACAAAAVSFVVWDSRPLEGKLPHLIAWNFLFGWLCWALNTSDIEPVAEKRLETAILLVSVFVLFIVCLTDPAISRAIFTTLIILPVIWWRKITLPRVLAQAAIVASQATLYLFFFHYYCFWAMRLGGKFIGLGDMGNNPIVKLVAGTVGPILIWATTEAAIRVYRRNYRLLDVAGLKRR
jgi:hypothetical protein